MNVTRQQHLAYHESGHAVVANALGSVVHWLELREDGSGWCNAKHLESEFDDGAIYVAGVLAAGFKFGTDHAKLRGNDALGLRNLSAEQRQQAVDRATRILRERWADVEALAARLLIAPDGCVVMPFPRDFSNP